ncbi:MAG: hypothetical protein R3C11_01505 [Planctomycetaceae bacterium]
MSEIAPEQFALGKKRIKQIFEYLKALNDLRNPAERQIAKQEWRLWLDELPDHVAIQRGTPQSHIEDSDADEESQTQVDDFILKVRRPELTNAPSPPEELLPWLRQGWKLPDNEQVQVHESRNETTVAGETIVVSFQEDSARPKLLAEWSTLRDKWRINELPSRRAMKCFERLYDLYGRMERESERVELVLGDGILSWHLDSGSIFHPILLQRVELTFDASVPEFTITESDRPVELCCPVSVPRRGRTTSFGKM